MKAKIDSGDSFVQFELFPVEPTEDDIIYDFIIFENYEYKMEIHFDFNLDFIEECRVFINDIEIVNCMPDDFVYYLPKNRYFEDCYDITSINVLLIQKDGTELYFYSPYLMVATSKQSVKNIEAILNEIEKLSPDFLNLCFSKSNKRSGIEQNQKRSFHNTINLLDEISMKLKRYLFLFRTKPKTVLKQSNIVTDNSKISKLNNASIKWLVNNPEQFVKVPISSPININGSNYIIKKALSSESRVNFDSYENRIILGFLEGLKKYITIKITEIEKQIVRKRLLKEELLHNIPQGYVITDACIYFFYQTVLKKLRRLQSQFDSLYNEYTFNLKCKPLQLRGIPKSTHVFRQILHYKECYELIIKWLSYGDFTLETMSHLIKLQKMSKIYEYYCLLKLDSTLKAIGFKLQQSNTFNYEHPEEAKYGNFQFYDFGNTFIYSGLNNRKLTLYYEPVIYASENFETNNIELYSTGYNFNKSTQKTSHWRPDFLLKISIDEKNYYMIFDAKFSSLKSIKENVLIYMGGKYLLSIATKDYYQSRVIGLWALFPHSKDYSRNYKVNTVNSSRNPIPWIGVHCVSPDISGGKMESFINEIVRLVEDLHTNIT